MASASMVGTQAGCVRRHPHRPRALFPHAQPRSASASASPRRLGYPRRPRLRRHTHRSPRRMFAALLSALLWLPLASSSFSADTIYADSTRTRASPAVKQAFWARASSLAGGLADGAVLRNDSSLPPLPGNLRRVALCITGGARSLALPRFGIPELWARNVVGGLAANETHAYYVLDTEFKAPKKGKRRGLRSHPDTQDWSVDWTELGRIFSILQPKAVHVVRAQSESRCGVSYLQFAKMAQCLEMIYETELLQGWRYDYVVRLRPDTQILSPFPPVQGLKRAIYTPATLYGPPKQSDVFYDILFIAHRSFAEAGFGAARLTAVEEKECLPAKVPARVQQWAASLRGHNLPAGPFNATCTYQECWLRANIALHNATVVANQFVIDHRVQRNTTE